MRPFRGKAASAFGGASRVAVSLQDRYSLAREREGVVVSVGKSRESRRRGEGTTDATDTTALQTVAPYCEVLRIYNKCEGPRIIFLFSYS